MCRQIAPDWQETRWCLSEDNTERKRRNRARWQRPMPASLQLEGRYWEIKGISWCIKFPTNLRTLRNLPRENSSTQLILPFFVFICISLTVQIPQTHQSPEYPSISYTSFPMNKLQLPQSNIWDEVEAGSYGVVCHMHPTLFHVIQNTAKETVHKQDLLMVPAKWGVYQMLQRLHGNSDWRIRRNGRARILDRKCPLIISIK